MDFVTWLSEQMQINALTPASLARQSGITEGAISHVFSGRRKPGFDFCVAIAPSLKQKPETVLRAAGLLPPLSDIEQADELQQRLDHLYSTLRDPKSKQRAINYLKLLNDEEASAPPYTVHPKTQPR